MALGAETWLLVGSVFLFTAFVKGTTGLGFSTIALPFLVLFLEIEQAFAVLIIASLASNILVMAEAGQFRPTVKAYWPLYLALLPGIAIGLALLDASDPLVATAVLGLVVLVYAGVAWRLPELSLPKSWQAPLAVPAGLATGLVNGFTGCQVIPMLPYFLALRLEANRFVQAINCSGTTSSLAMAVGLSQLGVITFEIALLSTAGLAPVWLGIKLGGRLRRRLAPEIFRRAVLALLALLGLGLLIRPLL